MKKRSLVFLVFMILNYQAFAQLQWSKSYGTTDFDYPRQIIRLSTGEFLFCGDNNGPAGYLAKIDSKGDSLWTKRIFPKDTDKTVTTITLYQINSSTFLVGGAGSKSLAPNTSYGCLWKFDLEENVFNAVRFKSYDTGNKRRLCNYWRIASNGRCTDEFYKIE